MRAWGPLPWLLAAVLAVYLPTLHASLQFDDHRVVTGDPRVASWTAWWDSMPAIRPLLRASYVLGHTLGGTPADFRAFNIAVHALNVVLALWLLRALGTRCGLAAPLAERAARLGAALFALHPIATEAVTYVSGRSSALSATFALAALLAWLHAPQAHRPVRLRALAALMALCAIATKEHAAMLPLALLALHFLPREDARGARDERRALALLTAVIAGAGLVLLFTTPYAGLLSAALDRHAPWPHALTQARGVFALLGHAVLPWTVAVETGLQPARGDEPLAMAQLACLVAIVCVAIAWLRRAPAPALAVLWVAIWLLPTHSLFAREDIANDRQFYLPLLGLAWLVALACVQHVKPRHDDAPSRTHSRMRERLAWTAVVALALCTLLHNRTYRTEVTYWAAAVAAAPESARAANNLGYAYALTCREDDALRAFRIAIRLDPGFSQARVNAVLLARGRLFVPDTRACTGLQPPPRA